MSSKASYVLQEERNRTQELAAFVIFRRKQECIGQRINGPGPPALQLNSYVILHIPGSSHLYHKSCHSGF